MIGVSTHVSLAIPPSWLDTRKLSFRAEQRVKPPGKISYLPFEATRNVRSTVLRGSSFPFVNTGDVEKLTSSCPTYRYGWYFIRRIRSSFSPFDNILPITVREESVRSIFLITRVSMCW